MSKARQAAVGRRKTWQGHDERDRDLCATGATELYDALTDSNERKLGRASELVRIAFWLSDEAERYQKREEFSREDDIYSDAQERLEESRRIIGLDPEPMENRIGWWQAYRHRDQETTLEYMLEEHLTEFGKSNEKDAQEATRILKDAAVNGHDKDDWNYVDDRLEDYYEITLPYIQSE